MPEATVFRARISVEALSNAVGSEFIFRRFCFLVEQQQKVAGEHAVEVVKLDLAHFALCIRARDDAILVNAQVDPILDVFEIPRIASSLVNEILPVKVKRLRVTPRAEIIRRWVSFHRRLNHCDGPISLVNTVLSADCDVELCTQ